MDMARPLRAAGIPVCIGGFHVSGCLSMLKTLPPDLVEAQNLGVSFFAGEGEERRLDEVLRDGFSGALKPIYNHLAHAPNLAGEPVPLLEKSEVDKNFLGVSSFDLGRGCPFECSFCTIINVQGRKSRFRTPDDLETIVRANAALGISHLSHRRQFRPQQTLGNPGRPPHCAQGQGARRLLACSSRYHGLQNSALCRKDVRGRRRPHLHRSGKHQFRQSRSEQRNGRTESEYYREMVLAWKKYHVIITCGYIIGFPHDTRELLMRDVETIKRDLAIDNIYLNYLTPLPGSEDHKKLYEAGVWMDPDMNKYTLSTRVSHHPTMSDADWDWAYREFHRRYYTFDHMETILRRMFAVGSGRKRATVNRLVAFREAVRAEGCSMLYFSATSAYGVVTSGARSMPIQSPLVFYPWHWFKMARGKENGGLLLLYLLFT